MASQPLFWSWDRITLFFRPFSVGHVNLDFLDFLSLSVEDILYLTDSSPLCGCVMISIATEPAGK